LAFKLAAKGAFRQVLVVVVVVVVVVTMITTMMKPSDRTAFQRFHLHFGRRWKVLELKFWSLS
jgi:hypothetical protein